VAQRHALGVLEKLLKAAWRKATGHSAPAAEIKRIVPLIAVLRFDVTGPDRAAATEMMSHIAESHARAPAAVRHYRHARRSSTQLCRR
jgi:hypothetical protein